MQCDLPLGLPHHLFGTAFPAVLSVQKSSYFTAILPWSPSCHICVTQRFKGALSREWRLGAGRGEAVGPSQGHKAMRSTTGLWFRSLYPRSSPGSVPVVSPGLLPMSQQAACSTHSPVGWFQSHQLSLSSQAETSVFTGASGGVCMCRVLLFHLVHGRRCLSRAPTG